MTQIKEMLETNTPFAVMQYYSSLRSSQKETYKEYELIYIDLDKKNNLGFQLLDEEEIFFIKRNTDKIKLIIDNEDGRIYEFNDFKVLKESLPVENK